jgi:hypothetical protein
MNYFTLLRIAAISMFFANSTTYTMEAGSEGKDSSYEDSSYIEEGVTTNKEWQTKRSSQPVTTHDIRYSNLKKVGPEITDKDIENFNQGNLKPKKSKWYHFNYKK